MTVRVSCTLRMKRSNLQPSWVSGCVHSPSRRVPEPGSRRASEPAARLVSGRPEPPCGRTKCSRVPADQTDSGMNSRSSGWAPLADSSQFGSVRFGSVQRGSVQLIQSVHSNLLRDGERQSANRGVKRTTLSDGLPIYIVKIKACTHT